MNEVAVLERFDIEALTPDQLELLQTKVLARQMNLFQQNLKRIDERLETQEAKIDIVKADQQKTIEVAANSLRVQQGRFEFVNQGDFGRFFSVSLSSVSVGKLLRIVGLAQPSRKGSTVPYRERVGKYAQVTANAKYSVTQWHYERCMERIDKWLTENGHYETFYSIQSEKELKAFIDSIHDVKFGD